MPRFKLSIAYDGTAYAGWQVQPGQPTVQQTIEEAIESLLGKKIRILASGRTDAGVHALGQVAAFSAETDYPPEVIRRALNARLPDDIRILQAEQAPDGFHPIGDAVSKRYRYQIDDGPTRNVFLRRYAWFVPWPLELEPMQRAAEDLMGRHDFTTFETTGSPRLDSIRTVTDLTIERQTAPHPMLVVEIQADGFLYNMVRNIVGTLVEIGRGVRPADDMPRLLAARDRRAGGMTAPPQGLFLVEVNYGKNKGVRS